MTALAESAPKIINDQMFSLVYTLFAVAPLNWVWWSIMIATINVSLYQTN